MNQNQFDDIPATGTTQWYCSIEVWIVLSPLIATVIAMLITVVILMGSGDIHQYDNLGKPLGKIHAGESTEQSKDSDSIVKNVNE